MSHNLPKADEAIYTLSDLPVVYLPQACQSL